MDRQKILETNAVIAGFLIIVSLIFDRSILVQIALAVLLIAIFIPKLAKLMAINWMKAIHLIGNINSKILLTFIFYLLLVPIALLARIFRKDPLDLQKPEKNTYYHSIDDASVVTDFNKMW